MLDTNVVSEVVRPQPDPLVLLRFAECESTAALAATSWHELSYGVRRLPPGPRREALEDFLDTLAQRFPVLPYDARAATWHASERARLERSGLTRTAADGQIAATAVTNNLTLVTRNVRDFIGFDGLMVETWWS